MLALQAAAYSVFTADDPYADNGFLLRGYFFLSAVLAATLDAPKKMVPEPGRRSKPERAAWGLEILIFGASRGKPGHIGILFMLCAD